MGKKSKIENLIGEKYEAVLFNEGVCFIIPNGVARIFTLGDLIGLEYADTIQDAKQGLFPEDGYLFDGSLPAEELAALMIEEIESDAY